MNIKYITRKILELLNTDIQKLTPLIKDYSKTKFDKSSTFLIKTSLFMWGWILRIYYKIKKPFIWLFLIGLCALAIYLILRYYETFVYVQASIIESDLNISFSAFFTAIGAAILGVLAITFSLSLFALQHAADRYTPAVFSDFLRDKTNQLIFWSIALISIIFFIFAVLPLRNLILLELVLAFILLILIFFLLRKQYFHITRFIHPNYQVISYHNRAIKRLNEIDRWLNMMIRIGAIRSGSNQRNSTNEST